MRTFILSTLLFIGLSNVMAQDFDPGAKEILDKVTAKYKAYTSLIIDFDAKIKSEDINESLTGKAYLKGAKYAYDTKDEKIICDGKTIWTYLKSENEVYINSVESADEDENILDPNKIFTLWQSGFKYVLAGETTKDGKKVQEIRLYPMDTDKKKYHTVIMFVDAESYDIHSMNIKGRDGVDLIYKVKKLTPNSGVTDSKFTFNKASFPGVVEVDMR